MKNILRRMILNISILSVTYMGCVYFGFIAPDKNTGPQGGARGIVIGVPLVLLVWITLTVHFTRKNGGDWAKVRTNLKHNFLTGLSFTWKDKGSRRTKK